MMARRFAWDLVSTASVATTTSVVLSRRPALVRTSSAHGGRHAEPAEFALLLERCRPEPGAAADHHRACRIHSGERPHAVAAGGDRGCRADTAFEVGGGGAQSGADTAEREIRRQGGGRHIAEVSVGGEASPILVSA